MMPSEILAQNGPLARLVEGYTRRDQQVEMAEAIAAALASGQPLICEAGTGTGKTFAYLIPAILSGLKVIISTGTRHLQDQLYSRDLPLVRRAMRLPVNVAMLKGRSNYLCVHRLDQAERDSRGLDRDAIARLGEVRNWSQATATGDLAELPGLPEESRLRMLVTSTAENCLYQTCNHYEGCCVFEARRRAAQADLIIVNHHLLLADLGLKEQGYGELLPPADAVIFDEAHQLPELASRFLSRTVSSHQWFELLSDCRAAYLAEAGDHPEFSRRQDRLETATRAMRLAVDGEDGSLTWDTLCKQENVRTSFSQWLQAAGDVQEVLGELAVRGRLLQHCHRRLALLLEQVFEFAGTEQSGIVNWLELRGRGFLLHRTPLETADGFRGLIGEYGGGAIFTSATLSVGGDFSHFADRLGLGGVGARSWPSPFDYRHQAILYVPDSLPEPGSAAHTERVVEEALPLLERTRGRAFILFTSYRALNIAAPRVKAWLPYPVFVQGEAPRTELLETFRKTPHSVLLGTGSFWEGVDVRGEALSCVIIDKLPFASPDDPVLSARLEKLEKDGRNPFMEYQLPEAVIALRQGIGRLIRDGRDYGVLMICDPRLLNRAYGRIFIRSLPDLPLTRLLSDVEEFLNGKEARN